MGSISDMHSTSQASAVLHEDADFLGWLRKYEGQTLIVETVTYGPGETIGTIVAELTVRTSDGSTETIPGPNLREVTESGVCGYDLQDEYDQDELKAMLEAAIANPDNGLDENDRESLREDLADLAEYYGG